MHGEHNAALWSGTGWSAAALDYAGDTTSMIVVVPDAGTFDAFEAGLTATSLGAILAGASRRRRRSDHAQVQVRDRRRPEGRAQRAGHARGVQRRRRLLRHRRRPRSLVQSVIHEAIIAVDEKGTTAAAATGIVVGTTSVPPTLVVDRPFLFFIRHNPTGAILFQGRVVDPSK